MKGPTTSAGLPSLVQAQQAVRDGKKLFDLVMNEKLTQQHLKSLVTQESLLHLILYTIDHHKMFMPDIRRNISANVRRAKRDAVVAKLHEWLRKNIHKYSGRLDACALDARDDKNLKMARGFDWIRNEITAYNKITKAPIKKKN